MGLDAVVNPGTAQTVIVGAHPAPTPLGQWAPLGARVAGIGISRNSFRYVHMIAADLRDLNILELGEKLRAILQIVFDSDDRLLCPDGADCPPEHGQFVALDIELDH